MFEVNIENLKKIKCHILFKKTISLSIVYIVYSNFGHEYEKIFKEESIEILKIFSLINNIEEHQKIYNHVSRKHKSRI